MQLRKDKCAIQDCLNTITSENALISQWHFTGSKSEGLVLAGSDLDYMLELNDVLGIHVSESVQQFFQSSNSNKFLLEPDDTYQGFALLKCIFVEHNFRFSLQSLCSDNDDKYLGGESFMPQWKSCQSDGLYTNIQGPSLESWSKCQDKSAIGTDMVPSIRCHFWPSTAMEWIDRPRHCGWPSLRDINTIVSYGFHLVAVGHHFSPRKSLQWRISFSIAERTLVWSFNHTQIQCYAVMKLILKEFIKVQSSESTKGVLCSYFIKTFLLWQYEDTDLSFWQSKNLRGCILYLLREFSICIREGALRHYFIPTFNLLEVKLTGDAKRELLQLFDIVVQCDMALLSKCSSLVDVWSRFIICRDSNKSEITQTRARQRLNYEGNLIAEVYDFQRLIHIFMLGFTPNYKLFRFEHTISEILNLLQKNLVKSSLGTFVLRGLYCAVFKDQVYYSQQENKSFYHLLGSVLRNVNMLGNDISSSRLWCATVLQQTGKYDAALGIINNVLSAIPPYALYVTSGIYSQARVKSSDVCKLLYKDSLLTREINPYREGKTSMAIRYFYRS